MDEIVTRAKFGNMYDWVHAEYCGSFKDITYIERSHDAICILRHRYNLQYNSKLSTHVVSFTSGTVDFEQKTIYLHPSYVIDIFEPDKCTVSTNDDFSHEAFAGYRAQVDFDVPRNDHIIRECMKHASIGIKQKKIIENFLCPISRL